MGKTFTVLLCAALLAACPAPTPTEDAGVDAGLTLSPVELCDRLAAARCDLTARCYAAFHRETAASCRSLEQARCLAEYETLRPYFDAQTVEIDAAKVLDCEERMKSSFCAPTFPPGYPNIAARPFSDCTLTSGLLVGNVPSGQPCEHAVECAPGTVCIKPGGVCRGTCSTQPTNGEPCGFGCAPGSFCDDQSTADPTDDRCTPARTVNEACASSDECAAALYCLSGSCRPRGKAGEPCVFDVQRLSTCEPGLACDVAPFVRGEVGTCVKPLSIGQPCKFHWSCEPGLVCFDIDFTPFPDAPPVPGVCQRPAPVGANCLHTPYALYVGDQCEAGTYCDKAANQCSPTPTLGDACTVSSQTCSGLEVYCKPGGSGDFGTCTGPAGQGERCAFPVDATRVVTVPCASGYCDAETTLTCRAPNKLVGQPCQSDGECISNRCAVQEDRTLECAQACL
ncbi:MAG: Dickkopf N-terminal cysteine-rich domain-containing protein [Myxococcota bacterium]